MNRKTNYLEKYNFNKKSVIIYAVFLVEFLVFFILRTKLHYLISPIILTTSGLLVALLPIYYLYPVNRTVNNTNLLNKKYVFFVLGLFFIVFIIWAKFIFYNNPIDISKSDIIPSINSIYIERFVNNELVYAKSLVLGFGYCTPNYLPFHWLPFLPARLLSFDFRWICLAAYFITVIFYTISILKHANKNTSTYIKLSLPIFFLLLIFFKQSNELAHTVELLIVSYYFLLAIFINNNSILGKSVGMATTILSRYVVVFYLPIAMLIEWYKNKLNFFKQFFIVTFLVSIFYIIPFLSKDWNVFFDGVSSYSIAAIVEWKGQAWQAPNDNPFQLFQGLGFASWIYKFSNQTIIEKVNLCKQIMLCLTAISIVALIVIIFKQQQKVYSNYLHLMALKIILTIVFAFSLVPYSYLFWSSFVVSIVIISNYNLFNE